MQERRRPFPKDEFVELNFSEQEIERFYGILEDEKDAAAAKNHAYYLAFLRDITLRMSPQEYAEALNRHAAEYEQYMSENNPYEKWTDKQKGLHPEYEDFIEHWPETVQARKREFLRQGSYLFKYLYGVKNEAQFFKLYPFSEYAKQWQSDWSKEFDE